MAITWTKVNACLTSVGSDVRSYSVLYLPEAATQTNVAGAPVVITSGYITEGADPVTAIFGWSLKAGQNKANSTDTGDAKVVPIVDGLHLFANFLATGDAGADNVLAAADLGIEVELQKAAVGPASSTIWHAADDTTDESIKLVSFQSDIFPTNATRFKSAAGDTNARCEFQFIRDVIEYQT